MIVARQVFITVLPDIFSLIAFLTLLIKRQEQLAKTLVDQLCSTGSFLDEGRQSESIRFVSDIIEISDLQKRVTLLALVSVAGSLNILSKGQVSEVITIVALWLFLFFLSTQIVGSPNTSSRRHIRRTRRWLCGMFGVWWLATVGIKVFAILTSLSK